ncbi:DUF3182 family protein [Pseudomonas matsuisoli]|uniref:DUF3182 domain-containing protein n=1 Tax=Pseudomonas matsuisoli TaxID=1515666 RepID=A0A917UTY0_9PSED|nr:DUF3182 family protein [Pseudomonas matsuisoli]GGJ84914.1 hypothetical protein GCM10009304_08630 [Pseudomonas matsuisoli]
MQPIHSHEADALAQHAVKEATAVFVLPNRENEPEHERQTHAALAARLAEALRLPYRGVFDPTVGQEQPYIVPSGTVTGLDAAKELGVTDVRHLFGGVVPEAFISTKAIVHPLVSADAKAPAMWSHVLGAALADSTLRGFTAFSMDDARDAIERVLELGSARLKPVRATAGRGQKQIHDPAEVNHALAAIDLNELERYGLVIEEQLENLTTWSVGRVQVAEWVITYYGTQELTQDGAGEEVYGGSALHLCEGDFDMLLALDMPDAARTAIEQARHFDTQVLRHYPGILASRRNYDIAQGIDSRGDVRSGVLEQSWRIGGASGAEIIALQRFIRDRESCIKARTVERYGKCSVPEDACVLFQGHDENLGQITKYVVVERYDGTQ